MKKYHTYIFDLDGTITDTTQVWIQIFRDCLQRVGINTDSLADNEIARHTHDWNEIVRLGVDKDSIPVFAEYAHQLANERLPEANLFPHALETLQVIRGAGHNLAIFSTMGRPMFEPAMQHHGLYDLVHVAVAGTDVPNRKPKPDGILKALADLGVSAGDFSGVMYMGDKDTDIQAAHSAGVDAVLFFPAAHQLIYDREATLAHQPATVLTDWQELLEVL